MPVVCLPMTPTEQFAAEVEAFLADYKIGAADFGHKALNDRGFVFELRNGRRPNLDTVAKVRAYMTAVANAAFPIDYVGTAGGDFHG